MKSVSKKIARISLLASLSAGFAATNFAPICFAKSHDGVTMADTKTVDKTNLVLNGMGTRVKTVVFVPISIYVAGLYLEKTSHIAEEILNSPEVKVLEMQFLHGVSRSQLADSLDEGIKKNTKVAGKYSQDLLALKKTLPDAEAGQTLSYTFLPDSILVQYANKTETVKVSPEFSKLVLSIWIGSHPVTNELAQGLLGF